MSETPAASQVAVVKNLPASARDEGSIPGSGRSPGEGHGYSLRYSCLENSMDRGAWWATVHGATESWTWLNAHTHSETAASRGEHEDTHLGILFLLPTKGHKQRSPVVPLHDDLSSPPSFVLGQIAFRLGVGGAVALPAGGFCVLIVTTSGGFLGASLDNTDGFFSDVLEPLRTSHCPCLKRLPALRFKDCALWL